VVHKVSYTTRVTPSHLLIHSCTLYSFDCVALSKANDAVLANDAVQHHLCCLKLSSRLHNERGGVFAERVQQVIASCELLGSRAVESSNAAQQTTTC